MKHENCALYVVAATIVALGAARGVPAQTSPGAPGATVGLVEIVVTARKREESDISVPVDEKAFTGAQLQTFATDDFFSLADRVPSLVIGENTGPFGPNLTLRGIGTSSFSATVDSSVSLNVDGLPINKGFAARVGLLDVAQVEVLKGPQALFFGKGSSAGVIAITSVDPTDQFMAGGYLGYEKEAEEKKGNFYISGPIGGTLKARLAVSYSDADGFFHNVADPDPAFPGGVAPKYRSAPDTKEFLGRASVLWEPSSFFDAKFKYTASRTDTQGTGGLQQYTFCPLAPLSPTEDCVLNRWFAVADLDTSIFTGFKNNGVPYVKDNFNLGSMQLNIRPANGLTITSLTGIVNHTNEFLINGTAAPGDYNLFAGLPLPPEGVDIGASGHMNEQDFTEELRLTTSYHSPVNGMIGAFYQHGDFHQLRDNSIPLYQALFNFPGHISIIESRMYINSISGFGQLNWSITPELELAAGARYTEERRSFTMHDNAFDFEVVTAVPSFKQTNTSPEATLTWRPTETLTLYGAYKEGFKSGSFNLEGDTGVTPTTDLSFKPETVKGGEVGLKTLMLDHKLRINATIYDYRYEDLQVSRTFLEAGGTSVLLTTNAGSATTKGIDLDGAFAVTSGLTLNGAVSYNEAKFDTYNTAGCWGGQTVALGCNLLYDPNANSILGQPPLGGFTAQDLSGQDLPRAPRWVGSLGFDYTHPINSQVSFGIASSADYTDSYYTDVSHAPGTLQGSYTKVNAAVRVFEPNNRWEATLIANNIGNKIIAPTCFVGPESKGSLIGNISGLPFTNGQDDVACFPQPGREIWLRVSYAWISGH